MTKSFFPLIPDLRTYSTRAILKEYLVNQENDSVIYLLICIPEEQTEDGE